MKPFKFNIGDKVAASKGQWLEVVFRRHDPTGRNYYILSHPKNPHVQGAWEDRLRPYIKPQAVVIAPTVKIVTAPPVAKQPETVMVVQLPPPRSRSAAPRTTTDEFQAYGDGI